MRLPPVVLLGLVAGHAACSINYGDSCQDTCSGASADGEGSAGEATETDTDTDGYVGWPGVLCAPDADETPRFYFDLQAGKTDDRDFFRMPFPADARLRGGGVDLTGFPRPPIEFAAAPELGDVVERWLAHVEQDTAGFAINGPVLFRSSVGISRVSGLHYVNVTPGHPRYGQEVSGLAYDAENGAASRNNYLCANWLTVTPIDGVLLDPGVTYAVYLTSASKPLGGGEFRRDADLDRMLAGAAPAGDARAAWDTFAPLREYLKSGMAPVGGGDIVAATVFTTAAHRELLAGARAAVHDGPLHAHDFHVCEAAGASPCAEAVGLSEDERAARRCGAPDPAFTEIHGRVTLPIFQEGRPPYLQVGGKIQQDGQGPRLHAVADVCFALTVPSGAAPDAGWPTVVYGHGTGGGFRSAIDQGFARAAGKAGLATLTLEGVLHGERRGDDDGDGLVGGLPLDQLVFNLRNPDSARDTPIQGAIDQLAAVRLASDLSAATWPDEPPAALDRDNLFFMGHSQGGQAGALFLGFEPLVRAAVLSGAGGNLIQSLLAKSQPTVDVGGVPFPPHLLLQSAFQERPDRPIDGSHPVLMLFNTFVNRADADAYSVLLRREPLPEVPAKHVLMYIGHVDSYTPLRTAGSLAIGAGLEAARPLFPPPCDAYSGDEKTACGYLSSGFQTETELPAQANIGGETAVALMRRAAAGEDGHYVAFTPDELERSVAFFVSALGGAVPTVED